MLYSPCAFCAEFVLYLICGKLWFLYISVAVAVLLVVVVVVVQRVLGKCVFRPRDQTAVGSPRSSPPVDTDNYYLVI